MWSSLKTGPCLSVCVRAVYVRGSVCASACACTCNRAPPATTATDCATTRGRGRRRRKIASTNSSSFPRRGRALLEVTWARRGERWTHEGRGDPFHLTHLTEGRALLLLLRPTVPQRLLLPSRAFMEGSSGGQSWRGEKEEKGEKKEKDRLNDPLTTRECGLR